MGLVWFVWFGCGVGCWNGAREWLRMRLAAARLGLGVGNVMSVQRLGEGAREKMGR